MTDPGLGFYGRRTDSKYNGSYYYSKNGCGGYGDECNNDGYMYAMALYNELNYIPEGPSYSVTHDDKDGNYRENNLMLKWYGNNEYNSFDVGDQKDNNVSETYNVEFRVRDASQTNSYSYSMNSNYNTGNNKTAISESCSPRNSSNATGYN